MERGELPLDDIVDHSYTVDDPKAAFEAFLNYRTCKLLFEFAD